ncbi:hypothetical protein FACS1894217_00690 [Clostridia bacterium]|nr:hypothetical protein FACS1894217_00690 [Clostridia bacterium]
MDVPGKVQKEEVGKWLACLNSHAKELRKQSDENPELKQLADELYALKEAVILKLFADGYIRKLYKQIGGSKEYWVFCVTSNISFHCPGTERLKEALRGYEDDEDLNEAGGCAPE